MKLLAIGVSARALAQSLRAAGLEPVAVDYFGDRDLAETCRHLSLSRLGLPYSTGALVEAARSLAPFDGILMAGGLENDPAAVAELQQMGPVLGNPPDVLERVRNWDLLSQTLRRHGFQVPPGLSPGTPAPATGVWLRKPTRGGGGLGVRHAAPGTLAPPGYRLEQYLPGEPGSALFLGDGQRARVLAVTEQLVGMEALKAPGFAYRGNILRNDVPYHRTERLAALCELLVSQFGLRGLNGVDFIWIDQEPAVLEVNPRWTASAELWERATGEPLVRLHLEAVLQRKLPDRALSWSGWYGKAILYGDRPGVWRFDGDWRSIGLRDVPAAGDPVMPGRPVCTLLVAGGDAAEVRSRLSAMAEQVRREWIV